MICFTNADSHNTKIIVSSDAIFIKNCEGTQMESIRLNSVTANLPNPTKIHSNK